MTTAQRKFEMSPEMQKMIRDTEQNLRYEVVCHGILTGVEYFDKAEFEKFASHERLRALLDLVERLG